MKKRMIAFSLVCFSLLAFFITHKRVSEYAVTDVVVNITESGYHPANDRQYRASVRMFTWDGILYFYPYGYSVKSQYYRELCAFQEGSVVSHGNMAMLLAANNGYVYYQGGETMRKYQVYFGGNTSDSPQSDLMCFNLSTKQSEFLATIDRFHWHSIFFEEDGTCYMPNDTEPGEYFLVKNGDLIGSLERTEEYSLGDKKYAIRDHDLVRFNEDGTDEILLELIALGSACIIPCDNGLLVYNEGASNLLYLIPEATGEAEELFVFEGFASDSAVNIHEDWVYVSVSRYESLEGCGLTRFENDTFAGTYRISLTDNSVEKLNDAIYDGLYIFDDTGIYACNTDGCIYKLDFDGNVIMTLLE